MSDAILIKSKAIPSNPRSKNYPVGAKVMRSGSGGNATIITGGGASIDVLKIGDMRSLTDRNVFSSLRTLAEILSIIIPKGDTTIEISDKNVLSALRVAHELDGINKKLEEAINSLKRLYLSKVNDDTAKGCLTLEGGAVADNIESQNFVSGALGEGFVLKRDSKTGRSYLEVDEAYIRMKAVFESLTIKELQHVGGEILLTLAGIECTKVEIITDEVLCDSDGLHLLDSEGNELHVPKDNGGVYRCYFMADDGSKAIVNQFVAGDMAQCKMFNIKEGVYEGISNRYYWRIVVEVGDDYIDLSVGDCVAGSDAPQVGDKIIQLGNRTDPARQNAILLSAYGEGAPLKQMLAGINDYSLTDKVVLEEGFDQVTHEPYTKNYGASYTGARDRSSFIEYIPGTGLVAHCVADGKVVLELNPYKKEYSFAGNITAESGDFGTFKIEGGREGESDSRRITFVGPETQGVLASMNPLDIPNSFPMHDDVASERKRNVGMYLESDMYTKDFKISPEKIWKNRTSIFYGNSEFDGVEVLYGSRFKCGLDLETRQFVRKFTASNTRQFVIDRRVFLNKDAHNTYIIQCNSYSGCKLILPLFDNLDYTDYVKNGGNLMCEFKFIAHPDNAYPVMIQSNPNGDLATSGYPKMYNKGANVASIQLAKGGCVSITLALFRDNEGDKNEIPYYRAIITNVY